MNTSRTMVGKKFMSAYSNSQAKVSFFFAVQLLLQSSKVYAQGHAPCHSNKPGEAAYNCEYVTVPFGMCATCLLKPSGPDGTFSDCTSIFDLDAPGCRDKLTEYADSNPCDTRRRELVEKWDGYSKTQLDYFVYSMCEQCCDNVRAGSAVHEYQDRYKAGTLWSLGRGNGPAHFFYDICTVLPKIKYFQLPGVKQTGLDHIHRSTVCNDLHGWAESGASQNWISNFNVVISDPVHRILEESMSALECHDERTWKSCVDLESKQHRL